MEGIFKYAIFHYNRLAENTHNLSYKIRVQGEILNLMTVDSTAQIVQEGICRNFSLIHSNFEIKTLFLLVCSLLHQRQIQGIFGPPNPQLETLVSSISYHTSIPFINVCSSCYDAENPTEDIDDTVDHRSTRNHMSINLYPSNYDLNLAFHNLTHKLKWTKFIIIYDMDSGKNRKFFVLIKKYSIASFITLGNS